MSKDFVPVPITRSGIIQQNNDHITELVGRLIGEPIDQLNRELAEFNNSVTNPDLSGQLNAAYQELFETSETELELSPNLNPRQVFLDWKEHKAAIQRVKELEKKSKEALVKMVVNLEAKLNKLKSNEQRVHGEGK